MSNEFFTLFYCMQHDDGFIVRGKHSYLPEGYSIRHFDACDWADCCKVGMIRSNNSTFDVIERVRVNYDRYAGGFIFRGFINTLTDEQGSTIENTLLDEWIEQIYGTCSEFIE